MIKVDTLGDKNVLLENASLMQMSRLDLRAVAGQFGVLLLLNGLDWDKTLVRELAEHLVDHKVRYVAVHGSKAKFAHDIFDSVRDKYYLPGNPVIMTVWDEGTEEEAVKDFLLSGIPDPDIDTPITDVIVLRASARSLTDNDIRRIIANIRKLAAES